jgi:hypothetical protein
VEPRWLPRVGRFRRPICTQWRDARSRYRGRIHRSEHRGDRRRTSSIALAGNGQVYAWGDNTFGCSNGQRSDSAEPTPCVRELPSLRAVRGLLCHPPMTETDLYGRGNNAPRPGLRNGHDSCFRSDKVAAIDHVDPTQRATITAWPSPSRQVVTQRRPHFVVGPSQLVVWPLTLARRLVVLLCGRATSRNLLPAGRRRGAALLMNRDRIVRIANGLGGQLWPCRFQNRGTLTTARSCP